MNGSGGRSGSRPRCIGVPSPGCVHRVHRAHSWRASGTIHGHGACPSCPRLPPRRLPPRRLALPCGRGGRRAHTERSAPTTTTLGAVVWSGARASGPPECPALRARRTKKRQTPKPNVNGCPPLRLPPHLDAGAPSRPAGAAVPLCGWPRRWAGPRPGRGRPRPLRLALAPDVDRAPRPWQAGPGAAPPRAALGPWLARGGRALPAQNGAPGRVRVDPLEPGHGQAPVIPCPPRAPRQAPAGWPRT